MLAGPTAVGKGTVSAYVREQLPRGLALRLGDHPPPRPGEVDGVHYHFVDEAEFERMEAAGELLESAVVHGRNHYGTPRGPVEQALRRAPDGAARDRPPGRPPGPRARMPEALFVFLAPPSWDELVRRLVGRGTEDEEERERRLETARVEMAAADEFDVTIVNDDVRRAAEELVSLMRSH